MNVHLCLKRCRPKPIAPYCSCLSNMLWPRFHVKGQHIFTYSYLVRCECLNVYISYYTDMPWLISLKLLALSLMLQLRLNVLEELWTVVQVVQVWSGRLCQQSSLSYSIKKASEHGVVSMTSSPILSALSQNVLLITTAPHYSLRLISRDMHFICFCVVPEPLLRRWLLEICPSSAQMSSFIKSTVILAAAVIYRFPSTLQQSDAVYLLIQQEVSYI